MVQENQKVPWDRLVQVVQMDQPDLKLQHYPVDRRLLLIQVCQLGREVLQVQQGLDFLCFLVGLCFQQAR